MLAQGLIHVAGVHFATDADPDANVRGVRESVGPAHCLLRVARWQEGLVTVPASRIGSVGQALRARLRWVGREAGSAVRQCLDTLLPNRPPPRRIAFHHQAVAEAVRSGWADIGLCHRLVGEEAQLQFLAVREENFDLCYPIAAERDPRLDALRRIVRSAAYRNILADLPGYSTVEAGAVQRVN
jgi:molybdate-binding protein